MARLTEYPAVSAYCSTFGRVHCLEEAIQCFLDQDYPGEKELVILNDYAEHELIYKNPEITIINVKDRISPLGKKFNKNIEFCKHDILACWEDDDYFMPHRLSYAVENMRNGVFHSGVAFVTTGRDTPWHFSGNHFHSSIVFHRELFDKVGGYPEIDNCTLDVGLMGKFTNEIGNYTQRPSLENIGYIYRWGNGSYHGSGYGTNIKNLSELAANAVQHQKGLGKVPQGKVILNPHLTIDLMYKFAEAVEIEKQKSGF